MLAVSANPGVKGRAQVQLMDTFSLSLEGQEEGRLRGAARRALSYLALKSGFSETRQRLASMLWEDCDQAKALRNLRQLIYTTRRDMGDYGEALMADAERVMLDPKRISVDVWEILESLGSGQVPDLLLSAQPVAERLQAALPAGGELFDSWGTIATREIEARMRTALLSIAQGRNPEQRRRAAEALLAQDRGDEVAARLLIAEHLKTGNPGSALAVYSDLWQYLDEEYGMEPAPPTQALITRAKGLDDGEAAPAELLEAPVETPDNAAVTACSGRRCTICVAPATVEPDVPDALRIAKLFRSELIACLSRFREFEVMDGEYYRAAADYLMACSASLIEERVNMSIHLTQTRDGAVLLGHRLGELLPDWRKHQAEITGRIAAICSASISRRRLEQMVGAPANRRVVDLWVMGQTHLQRFSPEDWPKALECYEKCIELDPDFSAAHSSIAQLLNSRHLALPGIRPERSVLEEARRLANRAIALDPEDSRAHLARAWSSCMLREYSQSAASFELARRCNPNDTWTTLSSAVGAAFAGEEDHAAELASRCLGADWVPTPTQWTYHATVRFLAGDDEGCVEAATNAGQSITNVLAWRAAALMRLGRHDEAARDWMDFDARARQLWVPETPPAEDGPLDWLLNCFPIARKDKADEFASVVKSAAARARQAH